MDEGPDKSTGRQTRDSKFSQAQMRIKQLEEALTKAGGTIPPLKDLVSKPVKTQYRESTTAPQLSSLSGPPPPHPPSPPSFPPPPPGCPPPPPGTSNPSSVSAKEDFLSKLGMKSKRKWSVEGNMKKTNWKAIPANKLTGLLTLSNTSNLPIFNHFL